MATSVLLYSDFCNKKEADIEDLFEMSLYLKILKQSCGIKVDPEPINEKTRIIKEIESQIGIFSHHKPADWLLRNSDVLRKGNNDVNKTLSRFEKLFDKVKEIDENQ